MNQSYKQSSIGIMEKGDKYDVCTRVADISSFDQVITVFTLDKERKPNFENRNHIYLRKNPASVNGPEYGDIGVWNWTASPKYGDETKDWIECQYVPEKIPYEAIFLGNQYKSKDEVKTILFQGVNCIKSRTHKLFLVPSTNLDYLEGYCCDIKQLSYAEGKIYLNNDISHLDWINISKTDLIQLPDLEGRLFYRFLNKPQVQSTVLVQSQWDIALRIIRERCNWAACKQRGLRKKDFQILKEYIEELPEDNLYQDISRQALISIEDAHKLASKVLSKIEEYFTQEDEEDLLLDAIVQNHKRLKDKYQYRIRTQWLEEHEEEIKNEKLKLVNIQKETEEQRNSFESLQQIKNDKEAELEQVKQKIESEKQEFETWKKSWILENNLRLNHNEYTSIYEEIQKIIAHTIHEKHSSEENKEIGGLKNTSIKSNLNFGKEISENQLNIMESWEEAVQTIDSNMYELAISREYSEILATILYFAFIIKKPILLIGPAAESICDGVSAALCQRLADSVYLQENRFEETKEMCQASREGLIRISNTVNNEVLVETIRLSQDGKHQYYLTHPFIEDMPLLPKSILNYFLIINTEPFVEDLVLDPEFAGGQQSKSFTPFPLQMGKGKGAELLKYGIPTVYANLLGNIIEFSRTRKNKESWDNFLLLGIQIPIFYMMGQKDFLHDTLENTKSLSSREHKFVENLLENMNG